MPSKKSSKALVANFVPLNGSQRTLLPNSRLAGPIDPSEVINVTVRTRSAGNPAALETKVKKLYNQPLKERKYLSRQELAREHGARAQDLDTIEQYAEEHNLRVTYRNAAERSVVLSGRLGDILNAFHADLHIYHHDSGTYRGRQGEILIPKQFQNVITGIFGFDTRPKHKSPHRRRVLAFSEASPSNGVPATEFAKRYNFPVKYQNKKLDGTGQCIAIIELGGGFQHSDLQIFFSKIGVPLPKVVAISVDHASNHPTKTGGADGEVMLDIEVAGAVAPQAVIAVYFAPNQGSGFFNAINQAVHDSERNPSAVSISWGGPEDPADTQASSAFHEVFVEAAALGVTICVASGDHGTADLDASHWDKNIHVDYPAADDYVIACGGTQIDAEDHDVVWNDNTPFDISVRGGGGWASGGGISETIGLPEYQKASNIPPSIVTGKVGRGVPDIAMSATNYFVRVQGSEGPSGGTSAVAPLMASLIALLNQAKSKNVGFLNPFLYATKGVVKDVISGTNAIKNTVKGYKARPGWDACAGLGTPDGVAILNNL